MEKRNVIPLEEILKNKSERQSISPEKTMNFCDPCLSSRREGACELQTSVSLQVSQGNISWAKELPKMPQFEDCRCPYVAEVKQYLDSL